MYHLARSRTPLHVPAVTHANAAKVKLPDWKWSASTYIICTNPRSGSWLLSQGLASTSLAGNPREWFNIQEEQEHRARWRMDHRFDLNYATYFGIARAESTTSNGISGIKLHYYQFAELLQRLESVSGLHGLTSSQLMSKAFPNAKYIWLTRRDKVRQAISFLLASATDQWWLIEGSEPDPPEGSPAYPEFDPNAIARREQLLKKKDREWHAYFEQNHIAPLIIHYEDLASDYPGTIRSVLDWLGIPGASDIYIPPARLRRQSNALSEEWLTRYEALISGGSNLAQSPAFDKSEDSGVEPTQKIFETIPNAWKQWVAYSKLGKTADAHIVEVLTNNGYSSASALAEVRKADSDPYLLAAGLTQRPLNKAASLLNSIGQLTRLDSQARVDRRSALSRDEFRDEYYARNRPVIINNLMGNWRAMSIWTPDYLKRVAGNAIVEVMTGRDADPKYEMNGQKHRRELPFADYIEMVNSGRVTNDYYLVPKNAFLQRLEAQPLLEDFDAFPEYLNPATSPNQSFLWFGPAGTVTPLHHEKSNILAAQVVGRKRYRLVPASQWQYVYNRAGVFSDVDCENPDLNLHPDFRNATMIDIVLEPGEVLFLPVGWWHHVRALDVSMTISFTNFVFPNHFDWEQ